jgi:hypothetical protein
MWDLTRHALAFFEQNLPFAEMRSHADLVEGDGAWCLAKPGKIYAVYAPKPVEAAITVPKGRFQEAWYNPRTGGELIRGKEMRGGGLCKLGEPPVDDGQDWVILIRKQRGW